MLNRFTYTICLLFVVAGHTYAQTYVTLNDHTGDWDDVSTWSSGTVSVNSGKIKVNGRVTRYSSLTIGNELIINDTLWVKGDLNMDPGSSLSVGPAGVLIIDGDMNGSSFWLFRNYNVDITNVGKVVVQGDVNISEPLGLGEADVDNQNDFYVYGDVNTSGGGTFTGSYGDETDLAADDSLYELVNGGTLPVTFLFVRIAQVEKTVTLHWATASEKNNDFFTVQRSEDGATYTDIGMVAGAGNSAGTTTYTFTDIHALPETMYYRIRQTDFDGQNSYSGLVNTSTPYHKDEVMPDVEVYPNPTTGTVRLHYIDLEVSAIRLTVYDSRGGIVYSRVTRAEEPDVQLDLASFEKGIYLLEVQAPNGAVRKKILLQ